MWRVGFLNYALVFSVGYLLAAVVYVLLGLPYRWFVAGSTVVPCLVLMGRFVQMQSFVDVQLMRMGLTDDRLKVYTRTVPKYRYYDLYSAAKRFADAQGLTRFETQHAEGLGAILNSNFNTDQAREVNKPTEVSYATGPKEREFLPEDAFWVAKEAPDGLGVVRVRKEQYAGGNAVLEVAVGKGRDAGAIVDSIVEDAAAHSVYKGKVVEPRFEESQSYDEFDGVVHGQAMDLHFLKPVHIGEEDIILEEDVHSILRRNVLEFYANRKALREIGLPGKRGLLFYGPPGTGKTYTTKYLAGHLSGVTTLVVSGTALRHVKAVCNAARFLQPTLVVMEDVDLVFSSREANLASAPLGDLMDELDGFGGDDEIIYILTTNAIERVEVAIKDRPGRISQCVYFGAPTAALRQRYLERLLHPYATRDVDSRKLATQNDGCTQAFLKELVFRAVQTCYVRAREDDGQVSSAQTLPLADEDFEVSMREMREGAGRAGEAIIGFRVAGSRSS